MGLFDQLVGGVLSQATGGAQPAQDPLLGMLSGALGGGGAQQSPLVGVALSLMQQQGGLPGLLSKLQQSGLGAHADSWVGTGANTPVSGDQMQQVFGHDTLANAAAQTGMSHADVGNGLAQLLPSLVNAMTPQGAVPDNHNDLLSQALSAFGGR